MKLELSFCPEHKAIWLAAATGALALARLQITKGKWRAHWSKAQAQAIHVAGCRPVLLRYGKIGLVRMEQKEGANDGTCNKGKVLP